ncbi:hypothetical protein [Microbacterium invictum]|uniref:T3SS peptide-binding chaperone domain-containing protein n=1 Tax=Microbacterium invictum TaxID=515415 RepID=A0AA40SQB6_9MICO|nr:MULTISPECIES: hypothetical protein [Microbacterium]MBB4140406.1 hypothetical protein [Microbacterium invictum]
MPLIAIHQVRRTKGARPEPVGAWEVHGTTAVPYYPPEHQKYLKRGEKALLERPTESLEEWVHFLAHKSPSWRIHNHNSESLFDTADPDVIAAYREEHWAFHQHVALLQEKQAAIRAAAAEAANDTAHDMTPGWGATRIALAQSWWIASELVRRQPQLLAYEMHPGGGQYDVLCVTDPASFSPHLASGDLPRVMLNRNGTLQVHQGAKAEVVATWIQALESPTPYSIVKDLERRAGWPPPQTTPATTKRALAYRLFASALTMTLNDRFRWDVRSEFLDTSEYGAPRAGYLAAFPVAVESARTTPTLGIPGEPESHFWALRRGAETVVIVSIDGQAYFADGKQADLMTEYHKHNRRINPTTVALLKNWI